MSLSIPIKRPSNPAAGAAASSDAPARPRPGLSRRRFSTALLSAGFPLVGWNSLFGLSDSPRHDYALYDEAVSRVVPASGFQSRIALKDSVVKLVRAGVIDRGKFFPVYGATGPHPAEFSEVLRQPSDRTILLTAANAAYYVNLLWPVGLATRMAANARSPINGDHLYGLASTGGWSLGREPNGGLYFNKFPIVELTPSQEAQVVRIAEATYRPCCNNSTFFQDCNHGSALLGLLQLGTAQGLSEEDLYREALAFNAFWFPEYYVRTALLFKIAYGLDWAVVDPKFVLGFAYSAGGPWQQNVAAYIDAIPGLIPPLPGGGPVCGV